MPLVKRTINSPWCRNNCIIWSDPEVSELSDPSLEDGQPFKLLLEINKSVELLQISAAITQQDKRLVQILLY